MSAYRIEINVNNTPEQEVFMSFQCSVLSIPVINSEYISFKSQAIEYSGKNRTEIPITCTCSIYDKRMLNKITKLQKGNRIDIAGNLIKNEEEIVVTITYLVYLNANEFSTSGKKDLSKIPWLDSSKKTTNENQAEVSHGNLPDFIANQHKKMSEVEIISSEDETNNISDNNNKSDSVEGKNK